MTQEGWALNKRRMGESNKEEGKTRQKKVLLRIRKDLIKKLVESNRRNWRL